MTKKKFEHSLRALPGALAWLMLGAMMLFSAIAPEIVAYVLLCYAVYWVFRTFDHMTRLFISFFFVMKDAQVDWEQRYRNLSSPEVRFIASTMKQTMDAWKTSHHFILQPDRGPAVVWNWFLWAYAFMRRQDDFRMYVNLKEEYDSITRYLADPSSPPVEKIEHLVIVPVYKETMAVLELTLEHLMHVGFPMSAVHVLFAMESADPNAQKTRQLIIDHAKGRLPNLYFSFHTLEAGEVAGKSANQAFAIRWFRREVLPGSGIDPAYLVVTSLDADYRMHPGYFADLTVNYAADPERSVHIFQPIPMFFNNIWKVNVFARVQSALGTQIQMARQLNHRENRSWSSYAASYLSVTEAGDWDVDVIQEDSRLFWKVFFRFGHRVRIAPLFHPVFGDAVHGRTYLASVRNLYDQIRRWAWGASDVPYVIMRCIEHREIPLYERFVACREVVTNYFNWATMPLILGVGTLLPLWFNPSFTHTVMGYNLPIFTSRLLTFTSVVMVFFIWIDATLSPKRPAHWTPWRKTWSYLQWLMMPVMGILFSALPALDAQTRLMMGKDLDYKVTEKGI